MIKFNFYVKYSGGGQSSDTVLSNVMSTIHSGKSLYCYMNTFKVLPPYIKRKKKEIEEKEKIDNTMWQEKRDKC